MNAAVRTSGGIKFEGQVPLPKEKATGQVLLKVRAAAINPVDYKLPKWLAGPVAGIDVAGVVQSVSPDVTQYKPGDEVFGFASGGSLAQYAVADADKLAPKPEDVPFSVAAALPTAHLTSYQALLEHGGGRVLIIGASGGCGLSACQLASAMGASEVVGVCSSANHELAKSQGATRCVDYNDPNALDALVSEGAKYDVVYDAATGSGAGEDYVSFCSKVVAKNGRRIAINGGLKAWLKLFVGWQKEDKKLILTRQNGTQLVEILELLRRGQKKKTKGGDQIVTPVMDSTHALSVEGVEAAFARLKSRRTTGKIVIDVA